MKHNLIKQSLLIAIITVSLALSSCNTKQSITNEQAAQQTKDSQQNNIESTIVDDLDNVENITINDVSVGDEKNTIANKSDTNTNPTTTAYITPLIDNENFSDVFYAIMNKNELSQEDIAAIENYLKLIKDVTILEVDASSCNSACDVYTMIQNDIPKHQGHVLGIQLFGMPNAVPQFKIHYIALNGKEIYADGDHTPVYTDLFYGNNRNNVDDINIDVGPCSVYDIYKDSKNVDFTPLWPVARLPLEKGQYKAFFDKYNDFVLKTKYNNLPIISFNSPNFNEAEHVDDLNYFLDRACNEFEILDKTNLYQYGTLQGECPVTSVDLIGDLTVDNISNENKKGIFEFFIYAFGRHEYIANNWYENGQHQRKELLTLDTINDVFAFNPYYLDCWACHSGDFEKGNDKSFASVALNGNCVGMFAITSRQNKTSFNCKASLDEMQDGNFFYFHYNYLKALHDGKTRAEAFFDAQTSYANALEKISKDPEHVAGGDVYQLNLYILLSYQNFGVIEPDAILHSKSINPPPKGGGLEEE